MSLFKHYVYMAPNEDRGDDLPGSSDELTDEEREAAEAAAAAAEAAKDEPKDEPKGEEDKSKKDTRIPLARHKEILEKERETRAALERQLSQYQKGQTIADVNKEITAMESNILTLEKEYAAAIVDGKTDEAAKLMADIRKAERNMVEAKSDLKIQAAEIRATERARYDIALERIEATYPVLNEDHENFDADKAAEVLDLKEAYQSRGLTPTAALQKAVKILLGATTTKQEIATTSQPRVDADAVAAARKAEAVKKTADAMKRTPPGTDKVGMDSDKAGGGKVDAAAVMKMSYKEFVALNDETLATLRGDTV